MLAAVAAADITPVPGLPLQGHWNPGRSHSVLYPLEIRSIVFRESDRTAAIVTIDVIGIDRATTVRLREQIQHRCNIAPDHVAIAASHTHCAPATLALCGQTPDPDYMNRLEQQVVATVEQAAATLEPVHLGLGCGSAHFNINRRPLPGSTEMAPNYAGLVDRRARLLRVDRPDGSPLAVVFHYSCHPTTKSGSDGFISPDYPGIARSRIEQAMSCRALFVPGCCGNIRPLVLDERGRFGSADRSQLDSCGEALARAVVNAARGVRTTPHSRLDARQVPLKFLFGPTKPVEELERLAGDASTPLAASVVAPWARRVLQLLRNRDLPEVEWTIMQALHIGPLLILTLPGEPAQEIGHEIERRLISGDADEVWPVGYTNDSVGYLCTDRHYLEGGYEPGAYPYYGRAAPFRDEQRVITAAAELLATDESPEAAALHASSSPRVLYGPR